MLQPQNYNWGGYVPSDSDEIVDLLGFFRRQPETLMIPKLVDGSFIKKLYSLYLTYLPKEKFAFSLNMKRDVRGSFTEILKTDGHGQFSVNISRPGVTKGQHWHNSKWEIFVVVSGHGLIQERKTGTDEMVEFEVNGEKPKQIYDLTKTCPVGHWHITISSIFHRVRCQTIVSNSVYHLPKCRILAMFCLSLQ